MPLKTQNRKRKIGNEKEVHAFVHDLYQSQNQPEFYFTSLFINEDIIWRVLEIVTLLMLLQPTIFISTKNACIVFEFLTFMLPLTVFRVSRFHCRKMSTISWSRFSTCCKEVHKSAAMFWKLGNNGTQRSFSLDLFYDDVFKVINFLAKQRFLWLVILPPLFWCFFNVIIFSSSW